VRHQKEYLLAVITVNVLSSAFRKRCLEEGLPYIGSSAGTNVSAYSINTTNDMPIVFPPSFEALQLVPFNINPHFLDADPNSTHKGETREQRIRQYQEEEGVPPVLAMREGSLLHIEGEKAVLKGTLEALVFKGDGAPKSYKTGTNLAFLFKSAERAAEETD
jgi:dipeptidase E